MAHKLFGRDYLLVISDSNSPFGLDISSQRVEFSVKKSLKPEPNTCDIKVTNLSENSRRILEGAKKLFVRLEAGYKGGDLSQLYFGEIRSAQSVSEGPDIVTAISTGDSEDTLRTSRINLTVGAKLPADIALRSIVKALGVAPGNIDHAVLVLKQKGVATLHGKATVITGSARDAMTAFCRGAGLEWSVQDGKVQILDLGKTLEGKAVELSSDTGLVGSPTVDNKGIATATTLIIPELRCGGLVSFEAKHLRGGYRIINIEYTGDTHGGDWYAKLTCKKY